MADKVGMRTPYIGGLFLLFVCSPLFAASYLVGVSKSDITGPAAGLATLGYAPAPKTAGIHQRLWARAFVVEDSESQRLAIVVVDLAMVQLEVKREVLRRLNFRFGPLFSDASLILTATHTHSAPAGIGYSRFYNIPAGGHSPQNFETIVAGITRAVGDAYESRIPGQIKIAQGKLTGANRNRSLPAYLNNPRAELDAYSETTNSRSLVLRFDGEGGRELGLLNWFAIHGTSIEKDNALISGDNKGFAAYLFETLKHRQGNSGFVAGFANADAGDASPNVAGDVDGDGDWDCAENENRRCAEVAGERQYRKARELYDSASVTLTGPVQVRHRYTSMDGYRVRPRWSGIWDAVTCKGAIGLAMFAGSQEDGPGFGREGNNCSSGGPVARMLCARPVGRCHGEKPVVVATGRLKWTANTVPHQVVRIGPLAVVTVPSEITTMAGRRLRAAVREELEPVGVRWVVIAAYANDYFGYVTTKEEYALQHYEGGHTLFGPWTLAAYQQIVSGLAESLAKGHFLPPGPHPPVLNGVKKTATAARGVDRAPKLGSFGTVIQNTRALYSAGRKVELEYWGANPNRAMYLNESLFYVERQVDGNWVPHLDDNDWNTEFHWSRKNSRQPSRIRLVWRIQGDTPTGLYRFRFRGTAHPKSGGPQPYAGVSRSFRVL